MQKKNKTNAAAFNTFRQGQGPKKVCSTGETKGRSKRYPQSGCLKRSTKKREGIKEDYRFLKQDDPLQRHRYRESFKTGREGPLGDEPVF